MNLTSEQVHWILGAVLVAAALLLILRAVGVLKGHWVDFVVPSTLVIFGIELALDPLIHGEAAPADYGAEMTQHFILSGLLLVSSVFEFLRLAQGRRSLAWRLPFVFALLLSAAVLALHAQHDAHAGMVHDMQAFMLLLVTQHRMMAATLVAAGLAVLFSAPDEAKDDRRALAFPLLILVFGAQLLLYTEGSDIFGGAGH